MGREGGGGEAATEAESMLGCRERGKGSRGGGGGGDGERGNCGSSRLGGACVGVKADGEADGAEEVVCGVFIGQLWHQFVNKVYIEVILQFSHRSAAIAQLVERLTSNQEVSSSNLGGGFFFLPKHVFLASFLQARGRTEHDCQSRSFSCSPRQRVKEFAHYVQYQLESLRCSHPIPFPLRSRGGKLDADRLSSLLPEAGDGRTSKMV